jgi:DNA polymerase III subunit epsilon
MSKSGPMFHTNIDLVAMAEALGNSTDYRVLRRLVPRTTVKTFVDQAAKTGVLLDVETTGLDPQKDEVIELGMVKFDYLADARIAGIRDVFTAFNEPAAPISSEVTALTGIDGQVVSGHRIDEAAVSAFVEDAMIVIAHNASFDRKFAERYWPVFAPRPGVVQRARSNGASMDSKARASAGF